MQNILLDLDIQEAHASNQFCIKLIYVGANEFLTFKLMLIQEILRFILVRLSIYENSNVHLTRKNKMIQDSIQ